ncbi:LacI family DNA-binding transcriptional regulator [Roseospira visakhapatnamensis]|uniref:LacI family gluconate utilization system Gnt-I transcriptional repressor n=1 Tax=Roseospira visakhapatnamensis TaxID=390880 RepID=A0A7W6RA08_9PROT|nr:LacI family DNA-binding transcriptional regulator [Roseospira visakhapatnamensis]MBB4264669.1 LacI family gluconate utilization system Gnt-I transcriptional repressor [Roseospira visakhapatnamensis]
MTKPVPPRHGDPGVSTPRRGGRTVTLDVVARLAGVAPATVSRAINQPDMVARKTLERVTQAIADTGYVPNLLAGGLASSRSHLIAAIVPSINNLVYAETIQSFGNRLKACGYQVLLGETGYGQDTEDALVTAVLSRRPDAIFLTGIHHSPQCRRQLLAAGIPVVETWDLTPSPLDLVVGFSHEKVGEAVAAFLHGRGCRRFGIVSSDDPRALVRNKAYARALERHGITGVASGLVHAVSSLELGRKGFADLIGQGFDGGGVFCSSDTLAQGVVTEALARGLRIPEDYAIVGFGDQNFAAHMLPALTTVKIDRAAIGEESANALLARLQNTPLTETVVDVGFTIMPRETA